MKAVKILPPGWNSEQKLELFITDEAKRGVAASTQNQALNALVFFYKAVLGTPLGEVRLREGSSPCICAFA